MADATTKFATFIASKKLDPRRIMLSSHKLESLTLQDRQIKRSKRVQKKAEGEVAEKETRKPRSGRPVTPRAMTAAMTGGDLSGPTKTRLVKAINALLEAKKQDQITLHQLF